jgi:hypothetical protein
MRRLIRILGPMTTTSGKCRGENLADGQGFDR